MATPRDSEFVTKKTLETGTQSPASVLVSPPQTTNHKNKRILIVEDDPLSLELMKIVLGKNGCDVTLAANGTEAITSCRNAEFDLVFMDLQMPDMDGFATATKIREVEQPGRRVPIVALTASNISGTAYEHFKTQFARILTKPFEIPTIMRAISDYTPGSGTSHPHLEQQTMDIPSGLRHFGLDEGQFREIFSEFLDSLAERLTGMEQALRSGDLDGLARRAHNLKGVSANVGAMQLAETAARLDEAATEADPSRIEYVLAEMRSAMHILQENARASIEAFFAATTRQEG